MKPSVRRWLSGELRKREYWIRSGRFEWDAETDAEVVEWIRWIIDSRKPPKRFKPSESRDAAWKLSLEGYSARDAVGGYQ